MLRIYLDVNVSGHVARGLSLRGVAVLTAQTDGADGLADELLLMRATELGCVLVSHDTDLVRISGELQTAEIPFGGVFYCHQQRLTTSELIDQLELIAKATELAEWRNQVNYLPL